MATTKYKWEQEDRQPTDDEIGNMGSEEYDYLQKKQDSGWVPGQKKKSEKKKTPPPPPEKRTDMSAVGAASTIRDYHKRLREIQ